MQPIFRFAPSPNGELHLGHAFSALASYALCRQMGGRFLLRIEDIDIGRTRPEFEAAIFRDLAWLGLTWEEPVRRQSENMTAYRAALDRLAGERLIYPAFMTRGEIAAATSTPDWPRDPDGAPVYPPHDRLLSTEDVSRRVAAGEPHTLRLISDDAIAQAGILSWHEEGRGPEGESGTVTGHPEAWGDFVVARKDIPTSYHLAVVVDDADQSITHVVRGQDLFHATSAHVLLQRLLGLPTPVYHHHRLITDAVGRKLSKSDRDTSLRALRENGATPADVRAMVGLQQDVRAD
ncbi:tRNA glutamyl-Q(34) synthetase GluQRS [Bauldia sp.]|uniref:tRNA glutamyl-Q(34) synthetase GluQRS n=1 Tax=Bauldia sp. TaxID=2575872 RepID=UPI003BA93F7A